MAYLKCVHLVCTLLYILHIVIVRKYIIAYIFDNNTIKYIYMITLVIVIVLSLILVVL